MDADNLIKLLVSFSELSFKRINRQLTKAYKRSERLPVKTVYSLHTIPELQIFEGDSRDVRYAKQFLALLLDSSFQSIDLPAAVSDFLAASERAERTHARSY